MVEPTRGGVVDGGAPQAPPGLDTRERLGVAYYYRVGFTPAGRYVTHSLPASADSESELVLRRLASEGQIVIMIAPYR